MNSFKPILRLAGVLAAAAITFTPLAAFAQTPQSQSSRTRIVFSAEQQAKFEQLQTRTAAAIDNALTPEQRIQFAAARENGRGFGDIKNLTDAQKAQIQEILQSFNTEIGNLLTPEQKEQIRQNQMEN
ncbi:hypothetical protein [Allocoleopsis franciscana]|uniref:P pilus assembly/Cpx signaling pathway, periplasmic inhibitor/zinc-resistance associated protein n=1 Tax=Allocoleopsis franciscana PCC 7113 TaxID=1173027 RepID=K9WMR4_9CYAN|nr:hypothetical protein [Allocoleopsis franciscana]AFZ21700.1 hypothetical protein Mic7113_6106 [Allocoleopsis franciscana PCC 7113]